MIESFAMPDIYPLRKKVMIKKVIASAVIVSALIAGGCASVPMASPDADSKAKTFATTPDKSNVYIYRNESMGAAIKMPLLIDGRSVGDTAANTYILQVLEPGKHTVVSKTENDSTLDVTTEAGKNYFIWQEVKMGAFAARSALHQVDEAKGKAGVKECKLIK
jgi:PBP1b-binding outer membrane lipoprotein LpoB